MVSCQFHHRHDDKRPPLQTRGGYHKYDIVFTIKSLPSTNSTCCLLNKNTQNRIKKYLNVNTTTLGFSMVSGSKVSLKCVCNCIQALLLAFEYSEMCTIYMFSNIHTETPRRDILRLI
jgi:hypothetical protein